MKRAALVLTAVALVAMTAGCTKDAAVSAGGVLAASAAPTEGSASAAVDPRLAEAINAFGFDLLRAIEASGDPVARGTSGDPNARATVISPLSVHAALSMAANGASGETLDEMRKTLRLDAFPEHDANAAYANLLTRLNASTGATMSVANSLWIDEGFPVKEPFVSANRRFFGSEVRSLDLQDRAAPRAINRWVSEQTHGKIDRIVPDDPSEQSVLEIVNATYFDGKWALPFEARATGEEPFYLADGATIGVPMMRQFAAWRHVMNAKYEAIELPYAGGSTSMVVIEQSPLSSANPGIPTLDGESFGQLWSELKSTQATEGSIHLPKLEARWGDSLVERLQALSMTSVFDSESSDLSRLSDVEPQRIDTVRHKTYLRVDEEGTEAAAVTEVGVAAGAAMGPQTEPFQMIVDRPYLMAIVDNDTGAVLFLATVHNPEPVE